MTEQKKVKWVLIALSAIRWLKAGKMCARMQRKEKSFNDPGIFRKNPYIQTIPRKIKAIQKNIFHENSEIVNNF